MLSAFKNIFKIKELKSKILYTLAMIAVVRLIQNIPVPGIDLDMLDRAMKDLENSAGGGLLQMFNVFSGGALQNFAIGVLGIMPYITASIILQLMTPVIPQIEKMQKEGVQGRQKYIQLTRYITIVICLVQGFFLAKGMPTLLQSKHAIVNNPGMTFYLTTTILLTAASLLIMWLGEQITDKGLGQGASIIITISVISSMPTAIQQVFGFFQDGDLTLIHMAILLGLFLAATAATVVVVQGVRKIPLKYAKRTTGSRGAIEKTSYMPLKVNHAGVMPIIFASALMMFPEMLANYFQLDALSAMLRFGSIGYTVIYSVMIIVFTFFWVATQFNPIQISDDLNRSGGFIPGIRPGEKTAEFLNNTMTRITYAGSVFLTALAIVPIVLYSNIEVLQGNFMITSFFGGTSLLIMVGVMLQTMQQIEVQLVQHNYEGFVSSGRLRSRSSL
ncbi:MAG: preprotein translocase subunit SecY [Lentisphaerales bacterium]|nr:preprotein translocase subunit SecY [Lentisphaerales bacterium]